jgi:sulfur carrier protein
VNGERQETRAKTLGELCAALGYGDARIATALNGSFIPATRREIMLLHENDRVEIVAPRQGG